MEEGEGEEFHLSESVVSGTTVSGPDEADSATAPHPPAGGDGGVGAASPGRRQRQKERISGQGSPPPPPPPGGPSSSSSSQHHPAGAPSSNRAPLIHSSSAASVVTTNSAVLGALGVLDRSSSRHKLHSKGGAGGAAAGAGSGSGGGGGPGIDHSHSGGGGGSATPGERGGAGGSGKARRSSRQVLDRPRSSSWASFDDYGGYSSGEKSNSGGNVVARKKKEKKQAKERERKAQVVESFHQHYGASHPSGTGASRPPSAPLPRGGAAGTNAGLSHASTGNRPPSAPPARQQYHQHHQHHQQQQQQQQQALYRQGGAATLGFDPTDDAAGRPTPPPPPLSPTQGHASAPGPGQGYPFQSQGQPQPLQGYPQQGQYFHPALHQQQQALAGNPPAGIPPTHQHLPQGYAMPPYGYYPQMAPYYPNETPSPPPVPSQNPSPAPASSHNPSPAPASSHNPSPNPSAYSSGGPPRNRRRSEEGRRRSEESRRFNGSKRGSLEYSEDCVSSSDEDDEGDERKVPSRRARAPGRTKQTSSSSNTKRSGRRHSSGIAAASNVGRLSQGHPMMQQQQSGFPPQGYPAPIMGFPQQYQQRPHGEHMVMPGIFFDSQQLQQHQQQQILAQHYLQYQQRRASSAISQESESAHVQQPSYGYQSYTPTPPLQSEEKEEEKPIGEQATAAAHYRNEEYFASNGHVQSSEAAVGFAGAKKRTSSVSFSTIEIRSYERVLGDNLSCSHGPAVSIGWQYEPDPITVQLDEYEYYRSDDRLDGTALVLSRSEREDLLRELGCSRSAIADAVRTNVKIKNNRRQTVHNLPVARFEEVAESARRKLKRIVLRKGKKDEESSVRYSRAPMVLHSDDAQVRRKSALRGSNNAAKATNSGASAVTGPSRSAVPSHVVAYAAVPPPRNFSPAPVSYTSSYGSQERKKKPVVVSEDNSLELGEDEAPSMSADKSSTGLSIGTGSMAYDPQYGQFR